MTPTCELALGRSAIYEFLSLAFLYPEQGSTTQLAEKASNLTAETFRPAPGELKQVLGQVSSRLRDFTVDGLIDEYVEVFGHSVSGDCPQYESEYDQAHVFQKSQTLSRLNAFYSAFGVATNPELKERPDHISVEMEFMHLLTLKEAYAHLNNHGQEKIELCIQGQRSFLAEHLAPWINSFVRQVSRKAGSGSVYGTAAHVLQLHMNEEFRAFGIPPAPSRRTIIPVQQEDDLECGAGPGLADILQGSSQV